MAGQTETTPRVFEGHFEPSTTTAKVQVSGFAGCGLFGPLSSEFDDVAVLDGGGCGGLAGK